MGYSPRLVVKMRRDFLFKGYADFIFTTEDTEITEGVTARRYTLILRLPIREISRIS